MTAIMTITGMTVIMSMIGITRIITILTNMKTVRGACIGSKGITDTLIGTEQTRGNERHTGTGVTTIPTPYFI